MADEKRAVLIIIDGWGIRAEKNWNAIALARTPHYSSYLGQYPNGRLEASGLPVGLPVGVMGNSEVGHTNIGAGRRVVQDQVRIHESIDDGMFFSNPALTHEMERAKKGGKSLHLMGLISQGNVHSAERHYLALIDSVSRSGFPMDRCFVHAILDGRDTPPQSAEGYLATVEKKLTETGGRIATVTGRFYAMDRDKRWERVDLAYKCFVRGDGLRAGSAQEALQSAYARNENDEFVTPTVITGKNGLPVAKMNSGDGLICFNFRSDRMREIVRALSNQNAPVPSLDKELKISIVTFTQYDETFRFPIAFGAQEITLCMGELVSGAGYSQFRTAETEKYAHVTYFFNGGREAPFENEERHLVPSPKVKTYDVVPEMSSGPVTEAVVWRVHQKKDKLIVVNFAQSDMVGHTGIFDAAVSAVESVDRCLGAIVGAAMEEGSHVFITADHGNIEMMKDPVTGEPHTAHTTNPVPLIAIGRNLKGYRIKPGGALCDISPTILGALELSQPLEMTGRNLLSRS